MILSCCLPFNNGYATNRPRFAIMKSSSLESLFQDSVFLPGKHGHTKVAKADILYAVANGAYVQVVTKTGNFSVSTHLALVAQQLDDPFFFRASRSHLVNLLHLSSVNKTKLYIGTAEIPASQAAMNQLLEALPIIRTKLAKNGSSESDLVSSEKYDT